MRHRLAPTTAILIVLAVATHGCRRPTGASPATPSFNVTVVYSDGRTETVRVPFMDAAAVDAAVRPFVAAAASTPDGAARPVRWVINDTRAVGSPVTLEGEGARAVVRMSTHTFREYRVVDTSKDGKARRELHARTSPAGEFQYYAQLHPYAADVDLAVGYLKGDARMFHAVASFKSDAADR